MKNKQKAAWKLFAYGFYSLTGIKSLTRSLRLLLRLQIQTMRKLKPFENNFNEVISFYSCFIFLYALKYTLGYTIIYHLRY